MSSLRGAFVISLDFELYWGVRDVIPLERYRPHLLGVREAIPAMLDLFARRGIAATWATVGMLVCGTKRELQDAFPSRLPRYRNPRLSPYDALAEVGDDEASDPCHFAPSLVERIAKSPRQELATHTFSHYYCLEAGQTAEDFDADLEAAQKVGRRFGDVTRSIVFPRNQYNPAYRDVLRRRGVRAYRSSGPGWPYHPRPFPEPRAARALRLLDAYVPATGPRTHRVKADPDGLVDVPASAFLRPYHPRARWLDPLRFRRIERGMTAAARRGALFHLWWHPHNFGVNLAANLAGLTRLLDHFEALRRRHGMQSMTMIEAADQGAAHG